jgi:hypothetical protein
MTVNGPMTRSDRVATLAEAKAQFLKSWDAWKAWAKLEEVPLQMTAQPLSPTIGQIEFELEKAERGMGMPYDAERVGQLRNMLREARKRKLSAGLKARREQE